jgi:putative tricarboxylic transport membrane protein
VNWRGFFAAPGISDDQKAKYVKALGDMYETKEWEEVRAQNKWVNIYNPGEDFVKFLEKQESEIGGLMKELGFL